MAVLPNADRADIARDLMREPMGDVAVTKAQLRAVINALDDYFSTNAAAMNSAIPTPQRTLLSAAQKAQIGAAVLLKRYVTGA